MKYTTRDFGEIELNADEIIEFVQPLFGFESYQKFALLHDEEIGEGLAWLQSLEDPAVCFVLLDPRGLNYHPHFPPEVEQQLGSTTYECWVIAVVAENFRDTTVNLKSPVLVSLQTRRAMQVILEQDYPVRFPIMKGE